MRYFWPILTLWTLSLATCLAAVGTQIGGDLGQNIESISSRGDVIAMMALATSSSIGTTVWLVKRVLAQSEATVTRLCSVESNFRELIEELRRRPCIHERPNLRPYDPSASNPRP